MCSSKVKKTIIEACRDTGYLERDAFERRPSPFRSRSKRKKKRKIRTIIKTYTRPSRHEFISSKQLNTPLLAPYEFVIAGTPSAMFVVGVFVSAILVQPREKRLKSSLNRTRIIMNDSFRQLQIKKK